MEQAPAAVLARSSRSVIVRSLACSQCGYDLRGLAIGGHCPECGLEVGVSVLDTVDPAARRLPRLRDPVGVGDALVGVVLALLLAALLLLARPVAALVVSLGIVGPRAVAAWMPHSLDLAAGLILLAGLGAVWKFLPPRGQPADEVVRRDCWVLVVGLSACGVVAILGWLLRGMPPVARGTATGLSADLEMAILHYLLTVGLVLVMLGLRGVLRVIGERSREYRTARGGRQRTLDMMAAAGGFALGETLRILAEPLHLENLRTIGSVVVWISSLMLVIGLVYLLVNAWWIRRSLRRPPPTLAELLGPPADRPPTAIDPPGPDPQGRGDRRSHEDDAGGAPRPG